jgi:hemolysin activation/secretion protein
MLHFNFRNALFLKTNTKVLNTNNPYENELYRIGGINSIRGFNEKSIITQKFNITNIEYHYYVNSASYLYTISDIAIFDNINTNTTQQLYGIGLGYYLNTKHTILDISYAVGKNYDLPFDLNNSKLHIKVIYPF